jgi:predicted  nucleic acid-binding Zn-ribbon protein
MPSRCTKCGKIHPDDAPYLLEKGCDSCGSRFFFFVKEESLVQAEKEIKQLAREDIDEIEKDVRYIVSETEEVGDDETVVLDVEAIHVIKPGKYRIDLTNLFSQRPLIVRVGAGRYEIDLTTIMDRLDRKKRIR